MAIRICVLGVPRFMHGGLEVGPTWTVVDKDATDRQRATLRDFHGRFIQVHREDRAKLGEFGLLFKDEHSPLEERDAKPDAPSAGKNKGPKPDAGGNTDAKKSDAAASAK